jgi:hypothetical protein
MILAEFDVGDSHYLAMHDGTVRGAHALIFTLKLETEVAAHGHIMLVTIFPLNAS